MSRFLPLGRGDGEVAPLERQVVDSVVGKQTRADVTGFAEFRVEPDQPALRYEIILEIAEQRGIRPDVLDVKKLPPIRVPSHDVRLEAVLLEQLAGIAGADSVADRLLEPSRILPC